MITDPFTYKNLYDCYLVCRKSKRNKLSALRYEINAEEELQCLLEELTSGSYVPSQSTCFVTEKPKHREIFAAHFRDRIVHHLLVQYLEPKWEPLFIHTSYACRKGKGTHGAVQALRGFMGKISRNRTQKAWFLQIDIRSFFVSIDKQTLFKILCSKEQNKRILNLLQTIIFHDPTLNHVKMGQMSLFDLIPPHKTLFNTNNKTGLPIGNYTSQFFANVYLNSLDQFVKHQLKSRFYLRYVDDLVLLHEDKGQLLKWEKEIDSFLKEKLFLNLNWNRRKIALVSSGADFLGYIVRPHYLLARRRSVGNFREKLKKFETKIQRPWMHGTIIQCGYEEMEKLKTIVSSYDGLFQHASTYRLVVSLRKEFPLLRALFALKNGSQRPKDRPPKFRFLSNQYRWYSAKFKTTLIFFKMGCFYEFFNRRARESKALFGLREMKPHKRLGMRCGFHESLLWANAKKAAQKRLPFIFIGEGESIPGAVKKRRVILYYFPEEIPLDSKQKKLKTRKVKKKIRQGASPCTPL